MCFSGRRSPTKGLIILIPNILQNSILQDLLPPEHVFNTPSSPDIFILISMNHLSSPKYPNLYTAFQKIRFCFCIYLLLDLVKPPFNTQDLRFQVISKIVQIPQTLVKNKRKTVHEFFQFSMSQVLQKCWKKF